ncbi:MAG TPA: hypothetical protein VFV97_08775 [Rhodanobacteraceae bacterium]|nr:hypothetical protein [Rhodanobacteraceae bacterium]
MDAQAVTLVVAAEPQTETELAMTLCLLEAAGVPAFVSAGVGSLYPGPQIASYNTRRVLVPAACRDDAEAALRVLQPPLPDRTRWRDRLRVLLEWFLFGWFVQGDRRRTDDDDDAAPLNPDAQDP